MGEKVISGNIVDALNSRIYSGKIKIRNGRIYDIIEENKSFKKYILPGFIDAHIHIESSLLTPAEFGRLAATHGTIAVLADPHEIANVLGIRGIKYMIKSAKKAPIKIYFGAPSCVPATKYESSGAIIGPKEIEEIIKWPEIKFLGEVMDFYGVINKDSSILKKIEIAKKYGKPIDGHAPTLTGKNLQKYVKAGISTDHESVSKAEALEKLRMGMKIQIREGSAAKNFEELASLLEKYYADCMLCSDDKHPNDLLEGHINELVKKAISYGIDLMKVLRAACINPVIHYKLDSGLLRKGDPADFIVVDDLKNFEILQTFVNGKKVAERGRPLVSYNKPEIVNNFRAKKRKPADFKVILKRKTKRKINVIEIVPNQLVTNRILLTPKTNHKGEILSDTNRDIIKVTVINRYREKAKAAIGFVKNMGIKRGAIASSIAHDSHNIIGVGVSDNELCKAINLIIQNKGGISVVIGDKKMVLPLPIAGLMSDKSYRIVAKKYVEINKATKSLGTKLKSPHMTLSFLSLLPIPRLKISDKGLFDVEEQKFLSIFEGD